MPAKTLTFGSLFAGIPSVASTLGLNVPACGVSFRWRSMSSAGKSSKSTGRTLFDGTTCEPSHPNPSRPGGATYSRAAIRVRRTAAPESPAERARRLSALSSSALLASFARALWSEKIRRASAPTLPGLGGDSETSLSGLAMWYCPSDSDPVALGLSISGTGCSCSRLCPTPTAAGFGVKDVPRLLDRRRRTKERVGNGNGFGLTFEQWVAVSCFTPTASDWRGSTGKGSRRNTLAEQLAVMFGEPGRTVYPHPEFVEAVMRFPVSWTELRHLATPLTQSSPSG